MRVYVFFVALLASLSPLNAQTTCPAKAPVADGFLLRACGTFAEHCVAGSVTLDVVPNTVQCPRVMVCAPPPTPYSVQGCDSVTFHFDDGTPDVTLTGGSAVMHTYSTLGLYHPSVRIANSMGAQSNVTPLVITPDPPAVVSLTDHFPVVPENAGSVTLNLQRGGNLSIASTVNWSTVCTRCGSLQPGSGTVTFAPGETAKSFTLTVHDDQVYSGDTLDDVYVSAADGTIFDPGNVLTSATIRIIDNDPRPTASIDDVRVSESGGSAHFTIHLSAPLGLDAVIAAYAEDGTARAGIDYIVPPSHTMYVSIPAGATGGSFDVPIVDNAKPESDKTFTITIYGWTGALPLIGRGTATCTILNDDFLAPATLHVPTGQSAPLQFDAGRPFAAQTVIPVAAGDPATIAVPASITIPAGSAAGTIEVTGLHAGTTTIGVQVGTAASQATIVVFDPTGIVARPSALRLRSGDEAVVTVAIAPAASVTKVLTVASSDPTLLQVPASVAVPPGGSAEVRVHALRADVGAIQVSDAESGAAASVAVAVVSASAPLVTAVAPASGPAAGGTRVTLSGSHFDVPCAATFGNVAGTNVEATGSVLHVTTPSHAEGPVDLVITCGSEQATFPNGFTYANSRRRAAR